MKKDYATQEKILLTKRQAQIYRAIAKNPKIMFIELAEQFNVNIGAIQSIVRALHKKGYLLQPGKVSKFEVV